MTCLSIYLFHLHEKKLERLTDTLCNLSLQLTKANITLDQ